MTICDKCRREIVRLEVYVVVGDVTLCDTCYMNMGTKEFLERIGGGVKLKQ